MERRLFIAVFESVISIGRPPYRQTAIVNRICGVYNEKRRICSVLSHYSFLCRRCKVDAKTGENGTIRAICGRISGKAESLRVDRVERCPTDGFDKDVSFLLQCKPLTDGSVDFGRKSARKRVMCFLTITHESERGMPMNRALDTTAYRAGAAAHRSKRRGGAHAICSRSIRRRRRNAQLHREWIAVRARVLGRGGEESLFSSLVASAKRHFLFVPILASLVVLAVAVVLFCGPYDHARTRRRQRSGRFLQRDRSRDFAGKRRARRRARSRDAFA